MYHPIQELQTYRNSLFLAHCVLLLLFCYFIFYFSLFIFNTPGSIGPRVKNKEKHLEVRIVVPSGWLMEQGHIRTLDCDRKPLENEQPFSAVTRHFTDLVFSCYCLTSFVTFWDFLLWEQYCSAVLPSDLLGVKEKHGLKAEAMRELGNVQYSVKNVRFVDFTFITSILLLHRFL